MVTENITMPEDEKFPSTINSSDIKMELKHPISPHAISPSIPNDQTELRTPNHSGESEKFELRVTPNSLAEVHKLNFGVQTQSGPNLQSTPKCE